MNHTTTTARRMAPGLMLALMTLGGAALVAATPADAQSARVRSACSSDYHTFCPSYAVGSTQLRSCMRSAGKRLSKACVDALVDSGEVSRKELRGR